MKHHLSIDLETFSSEPIAKTGAYKYVQSPDFEILLFAYVQRILQPGRRSSVGGSLPPLHRQQAHERG